MQFTIKSRFNAKEYTYLDIEKKDYLMVSISDRGTLANMFAKDPHMKDVCFLYFDDVDNTNKAMHLEDAQRILETLDRCIEEIEEIIVHCTAGVSRSAGTCAALMKILTDDDSQIFDSPRFRPNKHCYRTVLDAYFGSYSKPEFVPKRYSHIDKYRKTHNV